MPLLARAALVVAVVALAGVVLSSVTGALPRVVATFGAALDGLTDTVLASPSPGASLIPIPDPPALVPPENPYTNKKTATLSGTVPLAVVGRDDYVVRIYVAVPEQEAVALRDIPVGETPSFVAPDLPLENGRNDISATLVGPGGESGPSTIITFILDRSKPKITISSPEDRATVNGKTAKISGKTQGGATIVARNEANGTAATATAASDGSFKVVVPLSAGTNDIALTATDPAGNVGTAALTVRRGSGELTVALSASAYRISAARLPRSIELRAQVTDPDGRAVAGQLITFTLTIPGVPAITGDDTTDASGVATFKTTIPAGASTGSGLATAFASTDELGDASGRVAVTIIK